MIHKTYQVSMEVAGDTALWTRPDTGDSPCSYPAPTYSAVRGLFESILWGSGGPDHTEKSGIVLRAAVPLLCNELRRTASKVQSDQQG